MVYLLVLNIELCQVYFGNIRKKIALCRKNIRNRDLFLEYNHGMKVFWVFIPIVFITVLADCLLLPPTTGEQNEIRPLDTQKKLPYQEEATKMPTNNATTPTPTLQGLTEKAKEDLTKRLNIATTQITLMEAKSVIWSNSSLGCPQPGMMYAEVLTPGYLIILSVSAKNYEYHTGKGSDIFLCENPTPPVEEMPGDT